MCNKGYFYEQTTQVKTITVRESIITIHLCFVSHNGKGPAYDDYIAIN